MEIPLKIKKLTKVGFCTKNFLCFVLWKPKWLMKNNGTCPKTNNLHFGTTIHYFGGLCILFFNWSLVLKQGLELGHKRPKALTCNLGRIWKGLVFYHFSFNFIIVVHSTTSFSINCKMEVQDTTVEEFKLMK